MDLTDARWIERWSTVRFARRFDYPSRVKNLASAGKFKLFGSDEEPASSLWMASLCDAMGDSFRSGMTILDYGCGAGRLAQFTRERLRRFSYYGVEKPGSKYQHGEKSIAAARALFRWDCRIGFGLIGGRFEHRAVARANVAVLGSIFTHTSYDEMRAVLEKLAPIPGRGGKIVFSIFIGDSYRLENPGAYGMGDAYARTWFTPEQIDALRRVQRWSVDERGSFLAQGANMHRIFTLTMTS